MSSVLSQERCPSTFVVTVVVRVVVAVVLGDVTRHSRKLPSSAAALASSSPAAFAPQSWGLL